MHSLKPDLPHGVVHVRQRLRQIGASRRHSENAPSRSVEGSLPLRRPRMKHFHAFELSRVFQS